jgi:hypothetical protein
MAFICRMTQRMTQSMAPSMRKGIVHGAALVLLVAGSRSTLHAQPTGEGPLVLRAPASTRALGLGNAGIAINDGDAMFYNPGMLAVSRGFAMSMQRYGSNGTAGSMATTTTSGATTIGIGAQFLSYGAPAGASYDAMVHPGTSHLTDKGDVAATSTAFTLGLARTIKGLRLGTNVKYVEDHIGTAHDGAVAFDVGFSRPLWVGTVGITAQNLGAGLRINGVSGHLPTRVGVGFGGYQALKPNLDLGMQTALTVEGDWFVRPAGGVELAYVPIDGFSITLRNGFRLPREKDESLVTAGLGVTLDRYSLDYAMEPMRGGRPVTHRIGVRLR